MPTDHPDPRPPSSPASEAPNPRRGPGIPRYFIVGGFLYVWLRPHVIKYRARRRQQKGGGWPQPSRADMMARRHPHNASEEELVGYYKR
ncbi:hypothetical protein PG997_010694 [Apiospora hydei]|uniref:Uncharacterized protein n=1 Tax=Apiospora hydei TaxID=1337664 RepID=A0ABR1VJL8_9PEZI